MENHELERWRRIDITLIPRENLVDIRDVKLDGFAHFDERFDSFLTQIRNPYCFLCDGTPVRISFSDEKHALQDRLKRYFVSRKRG